MKTSSTGINFIKQFEGYKSVAYQDSVGVWTIGYGHTRNVVKGQTITELQAVEFLKSDVSIVENALNKWGFKLNQHQFDALVSLFYNVGTGMISNFAADLKANPNSDLITNSTLPK